MARLTAGVCYFGLWPLLLGMQPEQPKQEPSAFRTQPVKRGALVQSVKARGTLEPEEVIDVGAQVAGVIVKFGPDAKDPNKTIDYNSEVKAGAVLAQLDPAPFESRVRKAKAELNLAKVEYLLEEAKLKEAELRRQRTQNLAKLKVVPVEELDQAIQAVNVHKASLDVARAKFEIAEVAVLEAERNLDYATIRAPVAGTIIDRRVNVGQAVQANVNAPSLFLIAKDLKRMQVWAQIPEADIGQIKKGQPALIQVDAFPGKTFKGKTSQIRLNAAIKQKVVTYTVIVDIDNTDGKLLPYLTAEVEFLPDERKGR